MPSAVHVSHRRHGDPGVASLKVSFFGPFYGSLHVFALDEAGYSQALVSGPDRSYLWILARTKSLPDARVRALVVAARDQGFDTNALIWVEHAREDPALVR